MIPRLRSNDGASTVIVAISLLLLFAAGAIAIDLGSMWETKRDLVVDTDSAALAAARVAAEEGCTPAADQAAADFLSENLGATITVAQLNPVCSTTADTVTPNTVQIDFTDQAKQTLSGVLGATQLDVFASSIAEFNGGEFGTLRPITLCHTDLPISLTPPAALPAIPTTVIVGMSKTWKNPDCGGGSGTWGWLCFAAFCQPKDIEDYLEGGYAGTVDLGTTLADGSPHAFDHINSDEDCGSAETPPWCSARTGNEQQPDALDYLVDTGTTFSIVISDCIGEFDAGACKEGTGSNTRVHPFGFAYVKLDAWCERKMSSGTWHVGPSTSGSYAESDCMSADATNNVPVLALHVYGVSVGGPPRTFVNPEDAKVQMCGSDNDPDVVAGTIDHRCDRQF